MRIGLDLDGVVFDHAQAFCDLYNTWFGADIPPIQKWDDPVEQTHFTSHAECWQWASRAGLWASLPYVPGAPDGIDRLASRHQVVFVTSRNGDAGRWTADWHRTSPWKDIELRTAQTNKLNVPCGVYVDDDPSVIKAVTAAGKVGIVFDQPWNSRFKFEHRATSWAEVIQIVEGLS